MFKKYDVKLMNNYAQGLFCAFLFILLYRKTQNNKVISESSTKILIKFLFAEIILASLC